MPLFGWTKWEVRVDKPVKGTKRDQQILVQYTFFAICLKPIHKNPAYRWHTALSYVCDSGVPFYTMSQSQYHVCCQYNESIYTMSPCLYQESMSIPWVHVNSISPCLYHESLLIPCIHVSLYHTRFRNKSNFTMEEI